MENITLQVNNITTSYKNFKISNVSFQVKNGDIFGLLGRSGSGKSTLIKTLIGLKKQNEGTIKVYVNNKETPVNEVIGYCPQENSLYPFLTLEENLITFGKLYNVRKEVIIERIDLLLKKLDLQNARNKKITQLSGGMKKRADLAVALIHNPDILILDEPFSGLDISIQRFIWNFLKEFSSKGKIIIISSHILGDIKRNCNCFGLIYKGLFYGTQELIQSIRSYKEKDIESFLEKLFTRELLLNEEV